VRENAGSAQGGAAVAEERRGIGNQVIRREEKEYQYLTIYEEPACGHSCSTVPLACTAITLKAPVMGTSDLKRGLRE
jgi:hypothetical protein